MVNYIQKVEYVIKILGMSDKQTMAFSEKRQRQDMQDKVRVWLDICVPPSANPSTRMRNGVCPCFLPRMKRDIKVVRLSRLVV